MMGWLILTVFLPDSPAKGSPDLSRLQEVSPLARSCLQTMDMLAESLQTSRVGLERMQYERLSRALTRFPRELLNQVAKIDPRIGPDNPARRVRAVVRETREALDLCMAELLLVGEKPPPADATKLQKRERLTRLVVPQLRLLQRGEEELRKKLEPLTKTVQERPDKRPNLVDRIVVRELKDRQERLLLDIHLTVVMAQSQDADPPFREVTNQIVHDFETLKRRLQRGSIDPVTLTIAKDSEESLKELIAGYLTVARLKTSEVPDSKPLRDGFPSLLPQLASLRELLVEAGGGER